MVVPISSTQDLLALTELYGSWLFPDRSETHAFIASRHNPHTQLHQRPHTTSRSEGIYRQVDSKVSEIRVILISLTHRCSITATNIVAEHPRTNFAMQVHPVLARAIKRHEDDGNIEFRTSEPFVRSSNGKAYFTKIGSTSEQEQFVGEAEALKAMHTAAPGLAPKLIECGVIDQETAEYERDVGRPYFVSEYKNMGPLTDTSAKKLAQRLAEEMHQYKSTNGFGFAVPTFCGRTKQDNGWHNSWEECYDALIGGLLAKLEASGGYAELCKKGEQVRRR